MTDVDVSSDHAADCTSLTIYKADTVLIADRRSVLLQPGINMIEFNHIIAAIEQKSVNVTILDSAFDAVVVEHRFLYDLNDNSAMLKRYVGETIEVRTRDGQIHVGQFLRGGRANMFTGSSADDLILSKSNGQIIIITPSNIGEIHLPDNPDLVQQPTLQIVIDSQQNGTCPLELTYMADGIDWSVDYNLVVSDDDRLATFNGWVTLVNKTDVSFNDVFVNLIDQSTASPVPDMPPPTAPSSERFPRPSLLSRRDPSSQPGSRLGGLRSSRDPRRERHSLSRSGDTSSRFPGSQPTPAPPAQGTQTSVKPQYRYQIERAVDLGHNETRHVKLIDFEQPVVHLTYVYDASPPFDSYPRMPIGDRAKGNTKITHIKALLTFNSDSAHTAVMNLPSGQLRMYQWDQRGAAMLVSDQEIKHLAGDDRVDLALGQLRDVDGKRRQKDFRRLESNLLEETYRIRLRNLRHDRAVRVVVLERLFRWSNWRIVNASHEYNKRDASSITFEVTIPPHDRTLIFYTVRYRLPASS